MSDDRAFWEGIYRSLLSIAAMIKRYKLSGSEDEEDTREGLKALADVEGTSTWEHYIQHRDAPNTTAIE